MKNEAADGPEGPGRPVNGLRLGHPGVLGLRLL